MSGRSRRGRDGVPPPAVAEPSRTTGPVPIVAVIVRPCGWSPRGGWERGSAVVPRLVDGFEHALHVTLAGQQPLDAGRERVVDGRGRPLEVGQRREVTVLQQIPHRLVDRGQVLV